MSEPETEHHGREDPRVPVDRMSVQVEGAFYTHVIRGMCKTHGPTAFICIHPSAESKEGDLRHECLSCREAAK